MKIKLLLAALAVFIYSLMEVFTFISTQIDFLFPYLVIATCMIPTLYYIVSHKESV